MTIQKENPRHILIVGSGSVGKRHAQNLKKLGCRISCSDPRQDRINELEEAIGELVAGYRTIEEALAADKFDGVVIGSPTKFHPEQAIHALQKNVPVLLEKPVAITLEETLKLDVVVKETSTPLLLGYTWRWWGPLNKVKTLVEGGRIGKVRYVELYMSAHLADWHPWEDYQDFFMAKKELGGGALLDESHWIDLMLWFFGLPKSVVGAAEKISNLEIETDDNVDFLASYEDGKRVYVHLDLFGRPHERFIRFVGEEGTIFWSSEPNEIRISESVENKSSIETFDCDRNSMFEAVAKEFLSVLNVTTKMTCALSDGVNVMRVVEAIRESTVTGSSIELKH